MKERFDELVLCCRRDDEPPLIKGWIPFVGKALEFGRDAHAFLQEQKKRFGDVFTVHIAGTRVKYCTETSTQVEVTAASKFHRAPSGDLT